MYNGFSLHKYTSQTNHLIHPMVNLGHIDRIWKPMHEQFPMKREFDDSEWSIVIFFDRRPLSQDYLYIKIHCVQRQYNISYTHKAQYCG